MRRLGLVVAAAAVFLQCRLMIQMCYFAAVDSTPKRPNYALLVSPVPTVHSKAENRKIFKHREDVTHVRSNCQSNFEVRRSKFKVTAGGKRQRDDIVDCFGDKSNVHEYSLLRWDGFRTVVPPDIFLQTCSTRGQSPSLFTWCRTFPPTTTMRRSIPLTCTKLIALRVNNMG